MRGGVAGMFNMLECEVKPVKETLVVEGPAGKGIVARAARHHPYPTPVQRICRLASCAGVSPNRVKRAMVKV